MLDPNTDPRATEAAALFVLSLFLAFMMSAGGLAYLFWWAVNG